MKNKSLRHSGLKVLHVANFSLVPKGAGYFGVAFKLSNGLIRAGCQVLNFSDRDVARASSIFRNRAMGASGANRKLLDTVRAFRPDVVVFGHADTIEPETLTEIRNLCSKAKLVQWNVDPLFEKDNVGRICSKIQLVDFTFVSTAGASLDKLSEGKWSVSFLPNPVDPSIESKQSFNLPKGELNTDVFFAVGNENDARSHGNVTDTVTNILHRIKSQCKDVRFNTPGCNGVPNAYGSAYEDALMTSSMGLNLSRQNNHYLYTSDRMAQMAGCGILVFVDRATGYVDLFDEDCFGFYSTEDELIRKINYFSKNDDERRCVARRGWETYLKYFDTRLISEYMLDVTLGYIEPRVQGWPRTH